MRKSNMKQLVIYILGIITGFFLIAICAFILDAPDKSQLELFEEPDGFMEFTQFDVAQVVDTDCALANVVGSYTTIVYIIPEEGQHFFDNQEIILKNNLRAQRVGTYRYTDKMGMKKTVPAIRIIDIIRQDSTLIST